MTCVCARGVHVRVSAIVILKSVPGDRRHVRLLPLVKAPPITGRRDFQPFRVAVPMTARLPPTSYQFANYVRVSRILRLRLPISRATRRDSDLRERTADYERDLIYAD